MFAQVLEQRGIAVERRMGLGGRTLVDLSLCRPHAGRASRTSLPPHPGQFLLTVPQVARLLGMTPKAKYHCAERGQLPGVVRVWRSLLFGRADL